MYTSINQWSFPAGMSIREMMELAKANGFQGFEPALSETGELSLESTDAEIAAIRQQADEVGIRLTSLASGLTWGCSPTSNCPETRKKALDNTRFQLRAAKLIGVDAILLVPGYVGYGFWGGDDVVEYDDCWARTLENLNELKGYAEELGVVIGVENVWNNFLMSPLEMKSLIDQVNSPMVKVYLDVGNVIKYGMAETWVRILGNRICRVHVKDYKRAVGTLDGFVDLLGGDVNYPAVISELKAAGYQGPLTAEMNSGYAYFAEDVVFRTAKALEKILGMR